LPRARLLRFLILLLIAAQGAAGAAAAQERHPGFVDAAEAVAGFNSISAISAIIILSADASTVTKRRFAC
jgi:hypothetical protein